MTKRAMREKVLKLCWEGVGGYLVPFKKLLGKSLLPVITLTETRRETHVSKVLFLF